MKMEYTWFDQAFKCLRKPLLLFEKLVSKRQGRAWIEATLGLHVCIVLFLQINSPHKPLEQNCDDFNDERDCDTQNSTKCMYTVPVALDYK